MYKLQIYLAQILLCAFFAPLANAAPVFGLIGSISGCGLEGGGFNDSGAGNIEITRESGETGCLIGATGRAGGGGVGVRTNVSVIPEFNSVTDARITATAFYDDFEFVLPASYSGGPINVNVNTAIEGQIGTIVDDLGLGSQAKLGARLIVRGNPGGFNAFTRIVDSPDFVVFAGGAEGLSNSDTVMQTLLSGFVSIDPTLPFSVTLELSALSNINATNTNMGVGFGASTIDALNTFSFAKSGVVLNLPDGFSVNSVSANIVDNSYVAPIPLPPGIALMFSALALLGWMRRKLN